jgi:hypothetical protein
MANMTDETTHGNVRNGFFQVMLDQATELKQLDISNCRRTKVVHPTNGTMQTVFFQVMVFEKIQMKQLDISNYQRTKVIHLSKRSMQTVFFQVMVSHRIELKLIDIGNWRNPNVIQFPLIHGAGNGTSKRWNPPVLSFSKSPHTQAINS